MTNRRTIVVLGSNSFSGSDFIDLLLEDPRNSVVGVSRSPEKSCLYAPYRRRPGRRFEFHRMDLNRDCARLMRLLDGVAPGYVVNFAAQSEVAPSWEHPEHWFQTNTVALASFINELSRREYLARYVHISSPEVYGTCSGAVREDARLSPSTPYAASKAGADLLLAAFARTLGFPLITIRATNIYGPHQQLWKIIPRTAIYLKLGKRIKLHGGGSAIKSFIHIRDVSRGELAAMRQGIVGETYHLSPWPGNRGYRVHEVVARICQLMGRSFEESVEIVEERPGQDAAYVIDSSKARDQLDWTPRIELDDGLRQVIGWVERNWDSIRHEPLEYLHKV